MPLVDSHCHLQMEAFDNDREEVLARALAELNWLVLIGDTIESSRRGVEIAQAHDRVYATVGIHPHHADGASEEVLGGIAELAASHRVVAWGEIGLDYHYDFSSRENQRRAFAQQLEMADAACLPVVIHCREAERDFGAIIEPFQPRLSKVVMHCFGGDAAFAEECLTRGFFISFAGNVTFPKAAQLREAAQVVPLDLLMIETDSPYLAPQPVRGKRCEPLFVKHTAEFLAKLKGVSSLELAEITATNARRFYLTKPAKVPQP